jgi:hypothetical protein
VLQGVAVFPETSEISGIPVRLENAFRAAIESGPDQEIFERLKRREMNMLQRSSFSHSTVLRRFGDFVAAHGCSARSPRASLIQALTLRQAKRILQSAFTPSQS